ncbi:MAG: DinB family protein [Phycisphaerales bacterium]|nr:DinB family protein [Phycisphaerales bacterium]
MPRLPWFERRFVFPHPVDRYPEVVTRFRGLPARAEEAVRGQSSAELTRKRDAGWTIQENIGHLLDLETLFDGRLDDFQAGRTMLRAADLSNRATAEAGHNASEIGRLLGSLRRARQAQAARLDALAPAEFARVSTHPRLNIPMRLVDAVEFVCEHDDYHLTRIHELTRM